MNKTAVRIFRFIFNVAMFSLLLVGVTYYGYTNSPELFAIKNVLMPFKATMFIMVLLSMTLAVINEITTLLVLRYAQR